MNIPSLSVFNEASINGLSANHTKETKNIVGSFSEVLTRALSDVNELEVSSDQMIQKMIIEPQSVQLHELTTLLSQAEMALSMTKAITERVIQAYREITNLR